LLVVGEAANGEAALQMVAMVRPQVVLMDLRMPILDGVAATRRLRADHPDVQIIALTTFDDDADVFAALRAGAIGYLLKDVSGETLFAAVRTATRGESFLPPPIATKVVAELARITDSPQVRSQLLSHPLSERELEIVGLLARGATNREIAAALVLAEGTVKNHITNILGKLQVDTRTQAALVARELGLI
jgi:DNA-binding NarL/FixJ family response regulator